MPTIQTDDNALTVAVITGGHSFDVPGMHAFWRSLPGVDAYLQSLEDWSDDVAGVRDEYDVAVFYNMHGFTPTGDEPWPMQKAKEALEGLGKTAQGIIVWHHSLVAFPQWQTWRDLTAIRNTAVEVAFNETIPVTVEKSDHPVTRGVSDFDIVDETYKMQDPVGTFDVLLRAHHPKNMGIAGWSSEYGKSRVLCLQLGHDNQAWTNPAFRTLMVNGVKWTARAV